MLLQGKCREVSLKIPICENHVWKSPAKTHTFLYPSQAQPKQMLGSSSRDEGSISPGVDHFLLHLVSQKKISDPNIHQDTAWKGKTMNPRSESLRIRKAQSTFNNWLKQSRGWGVAIEAQPQIFPPESPSVILVSLCLQGKLTYTTFTPTTVNCFPTGGKPAMCSFFF